MKTIRRYLQNEIINDALAQNKIAFVSGPRQIGKTTLAESLLEENHQKDNYFNWDDNDFRKIWIKSPKEFLNQLKKNSIVVFDEIHKDRKWKNKLKGLFDLFKKDIKIIVTGSARLDFYRKSGDSLQGRYIPYRLHPFSVGETDRVKLPPQNYWDEDFKVIYKWQDLLNYGGFPEPFSLKNEAKVQRWQRLYLERMIKEDLRDLKEVKDIRIVENLAILLQEKVGSQLSYESLREDLSVSFDSVKRWIELLEALYYCYRIRPYSTNIKNSLKKEPKLFLYDWALLKNEAAKYENMIAGHLLKACHAWTDCAYGEFDLFYVRDKQKREIDFLITKNKKPYALIEVKSGQTQPTEALIYYNKILKPDFCIQVVKKEIAINRQDLRISNIQVMHVEKFLGSLV